MPEKQLSKKAKQYLKEGRHAIAEKLESTFSEYRKDTDEKDFKKSIKKASKILSASITLPTEKPVFPAKKNALPTKTKPVIKKAAKKVVKKAVAKKSK